MVSLPYVPEPRKAAAQASSSLLRRYATATTALLFVVAAVTGVLMFFRIGGHLFFALHAWLGLLFIAAALLHVLRNRTAFAKLAAARRTRVLLGVVAVVAAGFIASAQPRAHANNPALALTRAAERAPLSAVAPVLGMAVDDLVARLQIAGITVANPEQSLMQLAAAQGKDARRLFADVLKAAGQLQ